MCGIVGYFGGAGNNLTRVLTGMSAIIYRAPDSTGLAMFGDESEPVKTIKAVGSVERLVEELLNNGAYENYENELISVWSDGADEKRMLEHQKRLIAFEGLPFDLFETATKSEAPYPTYDDLVDLNTDRPFRLTPGQPGRPHFNTSYFIRSRKDLKNFVMRLIEEYDLSPVVIREIIRKPLMAVIASKKADGLISAETADVITAFDRVFETILFKKEVINPGQTGRKQFLANPLALKSLLRCLPETPVEIPPDYDRDGVCCMFRLLDAALLTRMAFRPDLIESLEKILDYSWPRYERSSPVDWKSLYRAEKGVNVYGWAAAAALTCMQRDDFLNEMLTGLSGSDIMTEASIVPGQTDPVSLRYLTQPVISHGRWAVQSAVNVKNAHPFLDEKRYRSVVINGQFDGKTEDSLRKFIVKVGKLSFRSENSAEYFPLLWGYYFEQLSEAKQRYRAVLTQVENDLQDYGIGSNTIDYSVHNAVMNKTTASLDETAFIEAAKQISKNGGQVAACGMSILSPRRLYLVSHNRPVFVVRRIDNDDFMVVSDINAAMGLFPQQLIFDKRNELERLKNEYNKKIAGLKEKGASPEKSKALKLAFKKEKAQILKAFSVEVHALDGEEIFARIETQITDGNVCRSVEITDFNGSNLPEIEPFKTVLNPVQAKKDMDKSFYETHLREIPDRLIEILRNYAPEEDDAPDFEIRKGLLRRRFGSDLRNLKRIVLAGTGSALYMCEIAKNFIHALMPELDVLVVRPGEIDNPETVFIPEKDLVILLSWSSTTADMVLLAKKLLSLKVVMICITEKTYADMAIIVAKSGGVIPCLSGEEVTVAGVKSTVCMLFCLKLFCLWVASFISRKEEALSYLEKMHRVPHILSNLLQDENVKEFSKALAGEKAQSSASIVISAINTNGVGREAALKLEESTWSAVGKALDYQEVLNTGFPETKGNILVMVDATCINRLDEAILVMELLYRKKIKFAAVSLAWQAEEHIKRLSDGKCIFLPDLNKDALQPLATLIFYYQFAFYYGHSHGIGLGVAPRNRAKSMTIGRNLFKKKDSPAKELFKIRNLNERLKAITVPAYDMENISIWEKDALTKRSGLYYQEMRRLAKIISTNGMQSEICDAFDENAGRLASHLFDDNLDIDEIIFAPMDRRSEAAAKSAADIWSRFIEYPVRIISPEAPLSAFGRNVLLFTIASSSPGQKRLAKRLETASCPVFRLEPEKDFCDCRLTGNNGGKFLLKNGFEYSHSDYLYTTINLIFINAWRRFFPGKAGVVDVHFRRSGETVLELLGNSELKTNIEKCIAANRKYETMFYIGPPVGTGLAWVNKFDRTGAMLIEQHSFGESAHGPIVTVDPRVNSKFVKLDNRKEMVLKFGEKRVVFWENIYLAGKKIDEFIKAPPIDLPREEKTPFFVDGIWYLPELQADYDASKDNLIVMDACWERYFDHALDEISTFGCRYPRMILMTQQSFLNGKAKDALYRFPVSNTIILPETSYGPIPEMHLPFVMNIIGEELAACAQIQK
ncbi:MAG: SIS domain-containing protein [Deltaproteobacteria bacterium]|nr:SIS domain-containing protein [Deltaproteobacteria bacterium]